MVIDVEVLVVEPIGAGRVLDHPLAEALVTQQPVRQRALEARRVHRPVEHHDADDHHQIGWRIHPQPGGIDTRHAFSILEFAHHFHRVAGELVERNPVQRQILRDALQRQIAGPFEDLFENCHLPGSPAWFLCLRHGSSKPAGCETRCSSDVCGAPDRLNFQASTVRDLSARPGKSIHSPCGRQNVRP